VQNNVSYTKFAVKARMDSLNKLSNKKFQSTKLLKNICVRESLWYLLISICMEIHDRKNYLKKVRHSKIKIKV